MAQQKHLGGHCNITHVDVGALKFLQQTFDVRTMVDVGCGPGGMQEAAQSLGITWTGVDGDEDMARPNVITHDYSCGSPFPIGVFDLAWSVEFVEHVYAAFIPNFMNTFSRARVVCISHALPGKKGYHHVNCQTSDYWINMFDKCGFSHEPEYSLQLRESSTMKREFIRNTGMIFSNRKRLF